LFCSDLLFSTQIYSGDGDPSVEFGLGLSQEYNYSVSIAHVEGELDALNPKLVQELPTDSPLALAHVRIPSMVELGGKGLSTQRDLLIIASHYFESYNTTSGGTYIGQSTVWERESKESVDDKSSAAGDSWQLFQTLETAGPVDLVPFEIDGTPWLAIANVS
jgi:hypothetical protein